MFKANFSNQVKSKKYLLHLLVEVGLINSKYNVMNFTKKYHFTKDYLQVLEEVVGHDLQDLVACLFSHRK